MNSEKLLNGTSWHEQNLSANIKIFHDSVYGAISLHPLCIKIIDTPQFQRLRFLSQVGCCVYVFPSASHTRFEHSIGVCHLAGQFARTLRENQPELDITDEDILCVEIAGLCHDLGHGPFSHLWEDFLKRACPELRWKHEECSTRLLNHLLKDNDIIPELKKYGLNDQDLIFVEEIITGPSNTGEEWPYAGRLRSKGFLYQIVANKISGVDVDKWDYFLRDGHHLGIKVMFEPSRLMKFSRVLRTTANDYQICFREKEVSNLYDMFHIRKTLHRIAYQHRVSQTISCMLEDAFLSADKHIHFTAQNGSLLSISEASFDMEAFTQLTDCLVMQIYHSTSQHKDMLEAKKIIHRIFTRRLYPYIGNTGPTSKITNTDDIIGGLVEVLPPQLNACKNDFVVIEFRLNYGMGEENPMEMVRFYSKYNLDVPMKFRKEDVSGMLPHMFEEKTYRILCRREEEDFIKSSREAFHLVCKKFNLKTSCDSWSSNFTPEKSYDKRKDSESRTDFYSGCSINGKLEF